MIAARKSAGLTQAELAARLGKAQSFVSKYEVGERRLDVIEFVAVAGVLSQDPTHFLREIIERLGPPHSSEDVPS
ncbi:helix-turn-helix transcriptional regulator [Deinococcus sp. YIM 134068]|uniref:helix-turn-helix domain-containing protein n=1 Tax=Deinococcus lichenicola TaxID=3118910 RepID=UPI002F94AF52